MFLSSFGSGNLSGASFAPQDPVVANQSVDFGALTKAGAGTIRIANTGGGIASVAIDSGDASNHWTFATSGGSAFLVPTSAGDTADLSGSPYSLACTFTGTNGGTDTATITVTCSGNDANGRALASAYHVADATELAAAITAIGETPGATRGIICRAGSYGDITVANWTPDAVVTISGENPRSVTQTWGYDTVSETISNRSSSSIWGQTLVNSCSNLVFKWLAFYKESTVSTTISDHVVRAILNDTVTFSRCEFYSTVFDKDETGRYGRTGLLGSSAQSNDTFKVEDCFFHDLGRGYSCAADTGANTVLRNVIRDIYQIPIELKGSLDQMDCSSNVALGLYCSDDDTGSPHAAQIAVQPASATADSGTNGFSLNGNILAMLYDRCSSGGIEPDGKTTGEFLSTTIKGNIVLASQHLSLTIDRPKTGCAIIGNTLVMPYTNVERTSGNAPKGPYIHLIGDATVIEDLIVANNIVSGPYQGSGDPGFGACATYDTGQSIPAQSIVLDQNNLCTGYPGTATLSGSVITAWPTDTQPTPDDINGAPRNIGYSDIFNGVNANGDFGGTDPDILTIYETVSGLDTTLGSWVGAHGSGYVTYESGHISNPQDVMIDTDMEPTLAYAPSWVSADGTVHLARGADLTGAADAKTLVFACTFRFASGSMGSSRYLHATFSSELNILKGSTDKIAILIEQDDTTVEYNFGLNATAVVQDTDYLLLLSVDTVTNGLDAIVIDLSDGSTLTSGADATANNVNLNLGASNWYIGSRTAAGADQLIGRLERVQLWTGAYADVSQTATQRLFVAADGTLEDPATAIASIGNPIENFYGAASVWNAGTNVSPGTGGDFTKTGAGSFADV